jgi:hypothetical protein
MLQTAELRCCDKQMSGAAMRVIGIVLVCIIVLIGGGVAWVKFIAYPDYSYRYRLTLAIEIDGQVHTGSSVIEVIWNGGIPFGDVGPYYESVRGQALLIDLGRHGVIATALVAPRHSERGIIVWPEGVGAVWLVPRAFGVRGGNEVLPQLTQLSGRRNLTPDNMPRLIWFSDAADPKTARVIKPGDIPVLFGPNARLATSYVEITHDPIVIDIDKRLPWYKSLKDSRNKILYLPNGFALGWTMFVGDAS